MEQINSQESENINKIHVTLKIEGSYVLCNKKELSESSDYFRAMFDGNFVESHKDVIELKDVPLIPFKIILALVNNPLLVTIDEDLLLRVLEVCILLQFNNIKEQLILRLKSSLTINNCIRVWSMVDHLGLESLCLEAKTLGLLYFEDVRKTDQIILLDLRHLYDYLADVKLHCLHEYHVFQECLHWWYFNTNIQAITSSFCNQAYTCFLCCMDFGSLRVQDLYKMTQTLDFPNDHQIAKILQYLLKLKKCIDLNKTQLNTENLDVTSLVTKLHNSQPRNKLMLCVFLHPGSGKSVHYNYSSSTMQALSMHTSCTIKEVDIAYYDESKQDFVIFANVQNPVWCCLNGYKVVGYLDTLYIVGGEFVIGKLQWNAQLWAYNCITKMWTSKYMPFVRRHFLLVVGGDYLYVIGGTGEFRTLQYNMFWYNIVQDKWSNRIDLPFTEATAKGGYCDGTLVLVDPCLVVIYIFNHSDNSWITINNIKLPNLIPKPLTVGHSVLLYNNFIYIKGQYFIKMWLEHRRVDVLDARKTDSHLLLSEGQIVSSFILGSTIYSIYKPFLGDYNSVTLEKYCTKSHLSEIVLENTDDAKTSNGFYEFFVNAFVLYDFLSKRKGVINHFDF